MDIEVAIKNELDFIKKKSILNKKTLLLKSKFKNCTPAIEFIYSMRNREAMVFDASHILTYPEDVKKAMLDIISSLQTQ